jgi:hypothetical protein
MREECKGKDRKSTASEVSLDQSELQSTAAQHDAAQKLNQICCEKIESFNFLEICFFINPYEAHNNHQVINYAARLLHSRR